MSENKHKRADILHPRVGATIESNPGPFVGKKFVKKAKQWVSYICYNIPNRSDIFEWEEHS